MCRLCKAVYIRVCNVSEQPVNVSFHLLSISFYISFYVAFPLYLNSRQCGTRLGGAGGARCSVHSPHVIVATRRHLTHTEKATEILYLLRTWECRACALFLLMYSSLNNGHYIRLFRTLGRCADYRLPVPLRVLTTAP